MEFDPRNLHFGASESRFSYFFTNGQSSEGSKKGVLTIYSFDVY